MNQLKNKLNPFADLMVQFSEQYLGQHFPKYNCDQKFDEKLIGVITDLLTKRETRTTEDCML